jgi:DNA polymerase III epsilon subunit-like protein
MSSNVIDMFNRQKIAQDDIDKLVKDQMANRVLIENQEKSFIMIDVETGGTDPFRHSLLTIGMLALEWDTENMCLLVKDELELKISNSVYCVTEEALMVNGIDIDKLQNEGVSSVYAALAIQTFVKNNFGDIKPIVMGHNVSMDKYFIWKLLSDNGLQFNDLFNHRIFDIMSLLWLRYFTGHIPKEACSSKGAYEYYEIENDDPHNALSDCYAQLELFEELIYDFGGWHCNILEFSIE